MVLFTHLIKSEITDLKFVSFRLSPPFLPPSHRPSSAACVCGSVGDSEAGRCGVLWSAGGIHQHNAGDGSWIAHWHRESPATYGSTCKGEGKTQDLSIILLFTCARYQKPQWWKVTKYIYSWPAFPQIGPCTCIIIVIVQILYSTTE